MGILLSLLSANSTFICLVLPSFYGWDLASWSCIFQITVVMKSSLSPRVKGTDGHKFGRAPAVFSVMVLQISRQLRKTLGFFPLISFVSHLHLTACWRGGGKAHCSRQGEDWFFPNFLQGRMPVACSTVRFPSEENNLFSE